MNTPRTALEENVIERLIAAQSDYSEWDKSVGRDAVALIRLQREALSEALGDAERYRLLKAQTFDKETGYPNPVQWRVVAQNRYS